MAELQFLPIHKDQALICTAGEMVAVDMPGEPVVWAVIAYGPQGQVRFPSRHSTKQEARKAAKNFARRIGCLFVPTPKKAQALLDGEGFAAAGLHFKGYVVDDGSPAGAFAVGTTRPLRSEPPMARIPYAALMALDQAIEDAIDARNKMDGDENLEDADPAEENGDLEASLGWTPGGYTGPTRPELIDIEDEHNGREPDEADAEPWLGSTNDIDQRLASAPTEGWTVMDGEPTLASTPLEDASRPANVREDDLELWIGSRDDREHDDGEHGIADSGELREQIGGAR